MCSQKTGAGILSRLCPAQPWGSRVLSVTSGRDDSSLEILGTVWPEGLGIPAEAGVVTIPGGGRVSEGAGGHEGDSLVRPQALSRMLI